MKKLLIALMALLLTGCVAAPKEPIEELSVLAPNGAPALSLINYESEYGSDHLIFVDGSDVLSAALISPTPEYDVIVAPINLGATLINKGSDYRLLGVITWGNLYLVVNEGLKDSDLPIALFGEGVVPGRVLNAAMDVTVLGKDVQYFNSVADVQVALLSEKASYGLLAEPALSATLLKAAQKGLNLEVAYDIQSEYDAKYDTTGYPQAAVFVLSSSYENKKASIDKLVDSFKSLNKEDVVAKLEGKEELFGVPSAAVIKDAWENMHIAYQNGRDVEHEISTFLKLFNIGSIDNLWIE